MKKRLTKEEIVERARKVHGDKYDYSEFLKEDFEYKNNKQKVPIICLTHGIFMVEVRHHLCGIGCSKCSNKHHHSNEEFVKKLKCIYGDGYDYSKTEYLGAFKDVTVTCKKHGDFTKNAHSLLQGHGCNKCAKKHRWRTDEWVSMAKEVHKADNYDYSKSEYINAKTNVCIICPIHGEFWQSPHYHLKGCGCPHCNESKLEKEIREFLISKNIKFESQKTFDWLKFKKQGILKYDFYLPEHKIAIECQGIQHFKNVDYFNKDGLNKIQKRDKVKFNLSIKNGIKLLYYSNIGIEYPYKVFENKENLLNEILNYNESNYRRIKEKGALG